jgi:hypothetical protein
MNESVAFYMICEEKRDHFSFDKYRAIFGVVSMTMAVTAELIIRSFSRSAADRSVKGGPCCRNVAHLSENL